MVKAVAYIKAAVAGTVRDAGRHLRQGYNKMECSCGLSELKALALTGHTSIPCNATQFGGMLVWPNCDRLP